MKVLKKNKKVIIGILLGLFIGLSATVSAATLIASNNVTYSNSNTSATDVKSALDELLDEKSQLSNLVKLGDYIQMTPTKSSYSIDTNAKSGQVFNPQELNLWRVINIKEDGTIEMVSEHVSSEKLCIQGLDDYNNYVDILKKLASAYENDNYTVESRPVGYYNQTLKTSLSIGDNFPFNSTFDSRIGNIFELTGEQNGFGDNLFMIDAVLIINALGTMKSYSVGQTDSFSNYFMASRTTYCDSSNKCYLGPVNFFDDNDLYYEFISHDEILTLLIDSHSISDIDEYPNNTCYPFRPILILKSGITGFSGNGTESNPYVLS